MLQKATLNQLGNVDNPYQSSAKRVLCVCSAGMLRSPTMANILWEKYGYNTRSCGVGDYALIPFTEILARWPEEILCANQEVLNTVKSQLKDSKIKVSAKIVSLDIPDMYSWNDPELKEIILAKYVQES